MIEYRYADSDFALSEEGLHLLRSGYNYETISYPSIEKLAFRNASPVRSPLLAIVLGILFIGLSVLQAYRVYQQFQDPEVHKIYIEAIVVVVLPFLVGCYLLYVALRKEFLLIVVSGGKTRKLSVKGLRASGRLPEAERFLRARIGSVVWA